MFRNRHRRVLQRRARQAFHRQASMPPNRCLKNGTSYRSWLQPKGKVIRDRLAALTSAALWCTRARWVLTRCNARGCLCAIQRLRAWSSLSSTLGPGGVRGGARALCTAPVLGGGSPRSGGRLLRFILGVVIKTPDKTYMSNSRTADSFLASALGSFLLLFISFFLVLKKREKKTEC